jgi:WD40 repeat protein
MKKILGLLMLIVLIPISAVNAAAFRQEGAVISTANAAQLKQIILLSGHNGAVFAIAFSPDGTLLASGGIDGTVRLWDLATATRKALLKDHSKQVVAVGFSADGGTLLSAGYDRAVRLWNVQSGVQIQAQGDDPKTGALGPSISNLFTVFSRDGNLLAYNVDGAPSIYIWDIKNKASKVLGTDSATTAQYGPVAFSSDGKWLATTLAQSDTQGNAVILWPLEPLSKPDAPGTPLILTGPAEAYYGNAVVFSSDSSQLAVVNSDDNAIHLFDLKSRQMQKSLPFKATATANVDSGIYGLAYNPDGSLLAAAAHDKTIHVWDVRAGKELVVLTGHSEPSALSFSADGKRMASANLDGSLEVWGVK